MTWARQIYNYHVKLEYDVELPADVKFIYPYDNIETRRCMRLFYNKYYGDDKPRTILFGINPGRFGAGITGIPFTDPVRLADDCGIENVFEKRAELSSSFIYECIHACGGPEKFYADNYISSVFPLGFIRRGRNFNYYDSTELARTVKPLIAAHIREQIRMGTRTSVAYSIGRGKNLDYLEAINRQFGFFDRIEPLPTPRWVMQYRLKDKQKYADEYVISLCPDA